MLDETVSGLTVYEPQRLVTIHKMTAELWLAAAYQGQVYVGQPATVRQIT